MWLLSLSDDASMTNALAEFRPVESVHALRYPRMSDESGAVGVRPAARKSDWVVTGPLPAGTSRQPGRTA